VGELAGASGAFARPELLNSPAFFEQKAEYIRTILLKWGWAEPEHYAWSSAHPRPRLRPDAE
jgi:hypothetical protein